VNPQDMQAMAPVSSFTRQDGVTSLCMPQDTVRQPFRDVGSFHP